jgi:hypothetical protein
MTVAAIMAYEEKRWPVGKVPGGKACGQENGPA